MKESEFQDSLEKRLQECGLEPEYDYIRERTFNSLDDSHVPGLRGRPDFFIFGSSRNLPWVIECKPTTGAQHLSSAVGQLVIARAIHASQGASVALFFAAPKELRPQTKKYLKFWGISEWGEMQYKFLKKRPPGLFPYVQTGTEKAETILRKSFRNIRFGGRSPNEWCWPGLLSELDPLRERCVPQFLYYKTKIHGNDYTLIWKVWEKRSDKPYVPGDWKYSNAMDGVENFTPSDYMLFRDGLLFDMFPRRLMDMRDPKSWGTNWDIFFNQLVLQRRPREVLCRWNSGAHDRIVGFIQSVISQTSSRRASDYFVDEVGGGLVVERMPGTALAGLNVYHQ